MRSLSFLGLVCIFLLNSSGCATTRKGVTTYEVQQLKMHISELEAQLQKKDERIKQLQEVQLNKEFIITTEDTIAKSKSDTEPKKTVQNIQLALKNAGFYSDKIDGKIGRVTKKAIKSFQKVYGLSADGIVGKKTWIKLKKYL